jgi:N-acetylglucosamine-6-phosphate deacetylase
MCLVSSTCTCTARERGSALEAIKIAVDHGVVAAVGPTNASYDQTHAGISAGAQTSTPLVSWAWVTRISTGDPADLVVLDSTLTPAAVRIGGIWIG